MYKFICLYATYIVLKCKKLLFHKFSTILRPPLGDVLG
jgi:hypothetical protein